SAYFKKSPPVQYTDEEARRLTEEYITKYGWKKVRPKKKPAKVAARKPARTKVKTKMAAKPAKRVVRRKK
ncbi:MAG: hypothetical protein JSU65_02040, partial [Candidatus Zixiibacteriota bacterium]